MGRQARHPPEIHAGGVVGRKHRDQIPEDDPAQPREGRAGILRRGLLLAGLRADRRARRREHGRPDGYRAGAGRDHALPPFDRRGNTRHDVGRRHDGRDGIQHLRRLPEVDQVAGGGRPGVHPPLLCGVAGRSGRDGGDLRAAVGECRPAIAGPQGRRQPRVLRHLGHLPPL